MEYERAIYRVYERCMEGLREETEPGALKYCRVLELITLIFAIFFLIVLVTLHFTFVSSSQDGCLRQLLLDQNITSLAKDQILYINIDPIFSPDNSGNFLRGNDDDYTHSPHRLESSLSSNIDYLTSFSTFFPKSLSTRILEKVSEKHRKSSRLLHTTASPYSSLLSSIGQSSWFSLQANTTNVTSTFAPTTPNVSYAYEFSFEVAILAMPMEMRIAHGFPSVNVTMTGENCFGGSFINSILPFGGIDAVVLNNIVQFVNGPGSLASFADDYYSWSMETIVPYTNSGSWISFKIGVLVQSCLCFFLLSTTTALLIRVLISSGVVLLFPVFSLLQVFGVNLLSSQIIRLSYPWIGVPMEFMRVRNRSSFSFVFGHVVRVLMAYVYYESCQVAFSLWLYDEITPGQVELWLFAVMMLWEYFTTIYVRSYVSIYLFPRMSCALFLMYHFYIFCNPFGFHLLALLVMQLTLTFLMIHFVRKYEVDAFYRGLVSIDQPRMAYNVTPWPAWMGALAPDFTVFMPLSDRVPDLYHQHVPVPGAAAGVDGLALGGNVVAAPQDGPTNLAAVNPSSNASSHAATDAANASSRQYQSLGQTILPTSVRANVELSNISRRINDHVRNSSSASSASSNEHSSQNTPLMSAIRGEASRINIGSSSSASSSHTDSSTVYSRLHQESGDSSHGVSTSGRRQLPINGGHDEDGSG